ncbi:hypothetical protein ASD00_32085 [Ensifer sp. Root31]|uniref:GntR family transcriptional regulator n=1 Tax=Ensifer sp. Root31 TaxID=1736512 RepID=UPI000709E67F|nr:GntR family transcriptional regulator [Ensifer sp. Root31]KQU85632.1 hypothetical protein ASD00_32085 [Ensifer sp. Root31]
MRKKAKSEVNKPILRGAEVSRAIRNYLLDGDLAPGSRINEVQLASNLGVSRTPVRAALQALAGEGLVEYKDNRGFFVREFQLSDVLDAFEMRALAEGFAVRLAAERGISPQSELDVEKALALGRKALSAETSEQARTDYSASNEAFHRAIHDASRSRLVKDVVALCNSVPQTIFRNVMSFSMETLAHRVEQHEAIYEAIIARKPKEAEDIMRTHVLDVRRAIMRDMSRKSGA